MKLVWDAYSIHVASKTGLIDMKRATSDTQGSYDRERAPKSGISGRENTGTKV